MSLHVRHRAWLNAVPERPKNDASEEPALSRLQKLRQDREDDSYAPDMPPVEGADYLLDYLWEIGPAMSGGMGSSPLSHTEIRSWQENVGIELNAWESRCLRSLSIEYIGELRRAEKRDCPAPWNPTDYVEDRSHVAKSLKASVKRLVNL